MTTPLVDPGALKDAGFAGFGNYDDERFADCILAATEEIYRMIYPRILIAGATDTVEIHEGDRATSDGSSLWLKSYPLISVTSVLENGIALVVGTGYDGTGALDVLKYAEEGMLLRKSGPTPGASDPLRRTYSSTGWAPGRQNVTVTYKGGFTAATVPIDIANACVELAILIYEQSDRMGKSDVNRNVGGSVSFIDGIPDRTQRTIHRYAPWGRPRTWAA